MFEPFALPRHLGLKISHFVIKTFFKHDSIFAERYTQVSNSYFILQTLSARWQRNQKMRVNFIHLLCICTFLHGLPLLEAQPTTMEEDDTCSSLQTVLMREEILLLKEQFAAISHQLGDSLIVQKEMLKNINNSHDSIQKLDGSLKDLRKSLNNLAISLMNPLACFEKPVPINFPYCQERWLIIQRRMDGSVDFYRGWRQLPTGIWQSFRRVLDWVGNDAQPHAEQNLQTTHSS